MRTSILAIALSIWATIASAQTVVYNPAEVLTDCNIIPGQCQTFYPDGSVVTNFTEQTTDPGVVVAAPAVVVRQDATITTDSKAEPLFRIGANIAVLWDCVSQAFVPPGASPCFGEVLRVVDVTPSGWLFVIDEGGDKWTVNPSRMIGFHELPGLANAQR